MNELEDKIIKFIEDHGPSTFKTLKGFFNEPKNVLLLSLMNLKNDNFLGQDGNYYTLIKRCIIDINFERNITFAIDNESKKKYYILKSNVKYINGDYVLVNVLGSEYKDSLEDAIIVKVLENSKKYVTGYTRIKKDVSQVKSLDSKFPYRILLNDYIESGMLVKCEIDKINRINETIYAHIVEVMGNKNDSDAAIKVMLSNNDVRIPFPIDVLEEVNSLSSDIDFNMRLDLTGKLIFTIDGVDAKDFDDAISLDYKDGNYVLGVHIADVSSYVKKDSKIDNEAFLRGTSIYIPKQVIPMLPFRLSDDLCSLMPNKKRLAISVFLTIDMNGNIIDSSIYNSVIESKYRLNYDEVNDLLDKNISIDPILDDTLFKMNELATILRQKRFNEGSIEFLSKEFQFDIDENYDVLSVSYQESNIATRLIEEFMLITNLEIATEISNLDLSSVYRVHDKPNSEMMSETITFINSLGYHFSLSKTKYSNYISKIITDTISDSYSDIIQNKLLRSMAKAEYSMTNIGHFGLNFAKYTHFTSPIRRYPDLIVHRIVKDYLINHDYSSEELLKAYLPNAINWVNLCEKKAIKVEREIDSYYIAKYMTHFIGKIFVGKVVSILASGFFVSILNGIEGFVRLSSLYEYYELDEFHNLVSYDSDEIISIGDSVKIEVINVNLDLKQIDFGYIKKYNRKR